MRFKKAPKCIGGISIGNRVMDGCDQVIKEEKMYSFILFYRLFLKHIQAILTVISDGRDMHTHKSNVWELKSAELHIPVKLSALFSYFPSQKWFLLTWKFLKFLDVQPSAKRNMRYKM